MSTSSGPAPPAARLVIEFYVIQLAHLADGDMSVSITATSMDDEEPQLLSQELVSERVATLDDAFALIKTGVERSLGP
ncbi:MAG TPA: hypothetical protein VHA70_11510 [Bauldia sp.]|nr:hypothetical protein [Bauldia sp.]